MASIYTEVSVDLPADELWRLVADVGAISDLLELVAESSVGDTRRCTPADGSPLTERILAVDDEHRRVAYTNFERPSKLEFHAASMEVLDEGDGRSRLRWITDLKPDSADQLGPLFRAELAKVPGRLG